MSIILGSFQILAEALCEQYNIRVAYNGKQALDTVLKFNDIDLILLDINMPVMDGFEVANSLKSNNDTKNIPFIFLTAYIEDDIVVKAFKSGAKDYIKKPLTNLEELLTRVETHLNTYCLQNELQEQKKEFETIFNFAGDGIAKIDLKGNFLTCNNAFLNITGFTKDELLNKTCDDLTAPEFKNKNKLALKEVFEKGSIENLEKEFIIKDNQKIYVNTTITLLPDKTTLLLIIKNITSSKLLEEQVRLASLSELIENIAHQWRQPLSIITTSISGLELKFDIQNSITKEEFKQPALNIMNQANYLSQTIEYFSNFIKDVDNKNEFIYISDAIKNTLSLASASLENNSITLIANIDDDIQIYANQTQLAKAFLNIINNAKDVLTNKNMNIENRILLIKTKLINKNSIKIQFKDSGGGIDKNIINRIFEPYFTSKHSSVGTGIGLSMTDKIIREKHKGKLRAFNDTFEYNSKQYYGACFEIILGESS